jgi:ribonuclease BN (tRNA processing enzyme)
MEIRVLGCHGSQLPGYGLTGFLIDGKTLLDAGAVTSVLSLEEQFRIERVLITHAHLDHIRELASLVDNICLLKRDDPLTVIGTPQVIEALRSHIFNGTIWPDFAAIPCPDKPIIRFVTIGVNERVRCGDLDVTAVAVHHSVETVAYVVEVEQSGEGKAAVFIGDTGPTEEIWQVAARVGSVRAIFVETSLPGKMAEVAELTGHLTPVGLARELEKLGPSEAQIYLYHMKIPYRDQIRREVAALGNPRIHVLRDGQVIYL